jgi:hypothetical protein
LSPQFRDVELLPSLDETIARLPGKRLHSELWADWDPPRSSGMNARTSPGLLDAGERRKGDRKATPNNEPTAFFFFSEQDGSYTLTGPAGGVRTGASRGGGLEPSEYHAKAKIPGDEAAAIHWHPDDALGYVDNPDDRESKGYGDSYYLQSGKPIATVYKGEIGWRELEDGRLVFRYPIGTMSQREIDETQRNLNREQKKFYAKKLNDSAATPRCLGDASRRAAMGFPCNCG